MTGDTEIIERFRAGTLPQLFVEYVRAHQSVDLEDEFRSYLIKLHNNGSVDLIYIAEEIEACAINQSDFFFFQTIFCKLLPELDAEVPAMLAAVKALVARAGNDLAGGAPNDAFRVWAEVGGRALATLAAIDLNKPDDAIYAFLSLQALSKSEPDTALDQAIAFLNECSILPRLAAAKAIGTLPLVTRKARDRAAKALEIAYTNSNDDHLLGHVLVAICEIARAAPEMEILALSLITAKKERFGDSAMHQASFELFCHAKDFSERMVAGLATIVRDVNIENNATIRNIDGAAYTLIQSGRISEGLGLIQNLISRHDSLVNLESFQSSRHALLELGGKEIACIIANWLLTLNDNLGTAARKLIGNHDGPPLVLDFDAGNLALSDVDTIILAHRAIRYLFVHPIAAASLVLALVRIASPEIQQLMANILFDPLLISYSGDLAEWLKTRSKDQSRPEQSIIKDILNRLDLYMEGLNKSGRISELRPSERERLIEAHRQQESMRNMRKEAEKVSVFMAIVKKSVILYGNRSISYFDAPDGNAQRNEMKLHNMSHSFEMPRLNIIEPFDLDYKLREFRALRTVR